MKSKLTLFVTWLFVVVAGLNANAIMRHHCPPENLSVTTGEAPGSSLMQWNYPTEASCQMINRFEVMVRICINNEHTTYDYIIDNTSMPLELVPGASCSWKVRSISFYELSTERHSIWARGPDIGDQAGKLDWDDEDVFDETEVYPNPVYNNTMYVHINSLQRGSLDINIVSLTGQLVYKETLSLERGSNYGDIELSRLQAGIYVVRVSDGDKTRTVKIVKL